MTFETKDRRNPPSRPQPSDAREADGLTFTMLNEIQAIGQLAHLRMTRALPEGMQISHFAVLNHLAGSGQDKSPAQLARIFQVTKGAMTNTVQRLERAGFVYVSPDFNDARRKLVSITPDGLAMRERAVEAMAPHFSEVAEGLGEKRLKDMLPALRKLRMLLDDGR